MPKITTIYALIDPRNQSPQYIGKTLQNPPQARLRQHLLSPANDDLAQWFNDLAAENLRPTLEVLEEVPEDADWRAAEIYWIRYAIAQNWQVKNHASGGDNYPLEAVLRAKPRDLITRIIYAEEETLRLLTSINAYVMKAKRVEDNTFRDLLQSSLILLQAEGTEVYSLLKDELSYRILSHGIVQMGRGWRVPVIKKQNPFGAEFFTVRKPFTLNGISQAGQWDKGGWRVSIKLYKESSEMLDNLATQMLDDGRRRGYNRVLQDLLHIVASLFEEIAAS